MWIEEKDFSVMDFDKTLALKLFQSFTDGLLARADHRGEFGLGKDIGNIDGSIVFLQSCE